MNSGEKVAWSSGGKAADTSTVYLLPDGGRVNRLWLGWSLVVTSLKGSSK